MTRHTRWPALALLVLLAVAGCGSGGSRGQTNSRDSVAQETPDAPQAGKAGHEVTMNPETPGAEKGLEERLRGAWEAQTERVPVTEHPVRRPDGGWVAPNGSHVTAVAILGWTRPREQDGVPFTAYVVEPEGRFWVDEGGGISGYDTWYGPFEVPRGEPR